MNTNPPTGATPAPRTRKSTRAPKDASAPQQATSPRSATRQAATSREASRPQGTQQHARQQKVGRVTSDKMQKTIVVAVESLKRHPVYKRTYKYTTKFKAHDEHETARIGDTVRIEETRPLSKEKRWRLVEILKRAEQTVAPEVVEEHLEEQEGLTPPSAGVGGGTGR